MTAEALLALVLRRGDDVGEDALVTSDDLSDAPPRPLSALMDACWLVPTAPATSVACDACEDGHTEVPELVRLSERDSARFYITCPEAGRVRIDPSRLRQWSVNVTAIATTVGALLSTGQRPSSVVDGRIWRLGPTPLGGTLRQTFIVRGAGWQDGNTLFLRLRRTSEPLVFTLSEANPAELPAGWQPLMEFITLGQDGFSVDWRRLQDWYAGTTGSPSLDTAPRAAHGRPRGRGFGALLECWMICGRLEPLYGGPHNAYVAVERYMLKHPEFRPVPPPPGRYSHARSEARSAHGPAGCPWHRHPESPPSDLLSV